MKKIRLLFVLALFSHFMQANNEFLDLNKSKIEYISSKSGVYEGQTFHRYLGSRGKKVWVEIQAFFSINKNTRKDDNGFFYIRVYKNKKKKKLLEEFYIKQHWLGSRARYYEVDIEKPGKVIDFMKSSNWKSCGWDARSFKFSTPSENILEIKSSFKGNFKKNTTKELSSDFIYKYYSSTLSDYKFDGGYFIFTKYLSGYSIKSSCLIATPWGKFDNAKEKTELNLNFGYKTSLNKKTIKNEESNVKEGLISFMKRINLTKIFPNLKQVNFTYSNHKKIQFALNIPDNGQLNSSIVTSSKEIKTLIEEHKADIVIQEEAKLKEIENDKLKLTAEYIDIKAAEQFLPHDERINFKKNGIKHYLFFEKIYHGLFDQVSLGGHIIAKNKKTAFSRYIAIYCKNNEDLIKNPQLFNWKTIKIENGIETDQTKQGFVIDAKYRQLLALFLNDVNTTNGFRALFDLWTQSSGKINLLGDIMKIYRMYPPYSKPAIRFRENLYRAYSNYYLRTNLPPITTKDKINMDFSYISNEIKLKKVEIIESKPPLQKGNVFINRNNIYSELSRQFSLYDLFLSNTFRDREEKLNILGNKLKAKIFKCTYYSPKTGKEYIVFLWKETKPLAGKTKYFNEEIFNSHIGDPVKVVPETLKEALKKFK